MRLHLLTAVTRPENLPAIEASIADGRAAGFDLVWHTQADPERQSVGGQSIKNALLDQISDGWVYILDDDNLLHPALWGVLAEVTRAYPDADMIALMQEHHGGRVRPVSPATLRSSHIDAGQVVVRRSAIGDARIPEHYCGDGDWIEALGARLAGRIVFVNTPACYYNWLRPT